MSQSKYLTLLIPSLLFCIIIALNPQLPLLGKQKLHDFSANATYWTTVSHFGNNFSGYQISGVERSQQALHSDR